MRWRKGKVTGGTMDMNPAIIIVVIIVIRVSGYPVLAVAIVTKLCDQWIEPYNINSGA